MIIVDDGPGKGIRIYRIPKVSWVKHKLADDLVMGFQPQIADIDGDGNPELIMRGIGLSKRVWTLQYDVTILKSIR